MRPQSVSKERIPVMTRTPYPTKTNHTCELMLVDDHKKPCIDSCNPLSTLQNGIVVDTRIPVHLMTGAGETITGKIIELSGTGGLGDYSRIVQVADTKPLEANRALGYLWARTRIARLSDFNFKRGNPENKDEITTLGLTYNLLTAYTSFIAVHEDIRNNEGQSEDVSQPLSLPLSVSNLAVGVSVSTVPEPEISILLMGVALMLVALIAFKKKSRRLHRQPSKGSI